MNLYCEEYSDLAKDDVLFLHGNLASHRWWGPTVREWKKLGSLGAGSLILTDWRGCGKNPDWAQDDSFSIQDLAHDHLAYLEKSGRGQVSLVGHSLGGLIALQMMILEPKRFKKAVLLDPVGADGVIFDDSMYEAFRQMAASPELTRTVILSTIENGDKLEDEFKTEIGRDAYKAVRGIGTSVLEILKSVDLGEAARRVNVPTLILHGAKDQVIPQADSEKLASLIPQAKLEILPNQGHCWNVEDPTAFTRRVRDWL